MIEEVIALLTSPISIPLVSDEQCLSESESESRLITLS